jgi:ribonuclease VapC
MFVDASAIVAIIKPEPEGPRLSAALETVRAAITSPLALVESVMSLSQQKKLSPQVAQAEVMNLLTRAHVVVEAIDARTAELAIEAHSLFGKGSRHPARLNLGDCFAYAMAKQHGVPLLYKGNDFAQTDLA